MLSLTTSDNLHMNSGNSDATAATAVVEKSESEMYSSSHSAESVGSDDKLTKRPPLSPSASTPKGPTKSPRIQEFQPLKCRCERTFVGIAEFVLHAQSCPELAISTEKAVDLSFASRKADQGHQASSTDPLDLTVRGGESCSAPSVSNPTLTCPECKVSMMSHMQLLRHFETSHGVYGSFACSCGVEFSWLPAFLSHHLLCPMSGIKKPAFGTSFLKKNIPLPVRHVKPPQQPQQPLPMLQNQPQQQQQTDVLRPFKCCHCVKSFKSKALLDQHMHIHYPPKYTCRYCAKKYRWPPVFYHHQRTCKKRPPTTTTNTTLNPSASNSNAGRSNDPLPNRSFGSRPQQTPGYQLPPPPPTMLNLTPPFLPLGQESRPPPHQGFILSPPAGFPRPWERKDTSNMMSMASMRLPHFPLPLGASPDLLNFPSPHQPSTLPTPQPSIALPPPPPPLPHMLPFFSAMEKLEENGEKPSPVTCVCGTTFEGLPPYLGHIASCSMFGRALSIPPPPPLPPVPEDGGSAAFLANMIAVLEKCKPEFFQQFLNRGSPQPGTDLLEGGASGGGLNSCEQCGKEFSSRLSLKQHVEGKHSTEGKYQCPGCAKRYRWGASYYYHKKSCPAVPSRDNDDDDEGDEGEMADCGSLPNPSVSSSNMGENGLCTDMLFQATTKGLLEHQRKQRLHIGSNLLISALNFGENSEEGEMEKLRNSMVKSEVEGSITHDDLSRQPLRKMEPCGDFEGSIPTTSTPMP